MGWTRAHHAWAGWPQHQTHATVAPVGPRPPSRNNTVMGLCRGSCPASTRPPARPTHPGSHPDATSSRRWRRGLWRASRRSSYHRYAHPRRKPATKNAPTRSCRAALMPAWGASPSGTIQNILGVPPLDAVQSTFALTTAQGSARSCPKALSPTGSACSRPATTAPPGLCGSVTSGSSSVAPGVPARDAVPRRQRGGRGPRSLRQFLPRR